MPHDKSKLAAAVLTALLCALLCALPCAAAGTAAKTAASELAGLGLFNGVGQTADGSVDYDLDSPATRETAVTILVRLMGRESQAQAGSYTLPFSDVSSWAMKNVGWAYQNGYAAGTGATTFDGAAGITAQQYVTLLLRALGYSDAAGDFTYAGACAFAKTIGLNSGGYTNQTSGFTRGDIAILSNAALRLAYNGGSVSMYQHYFGKALPAAASAQAQSTTAANSTGSTGKTGSGSTNSTGNTGSTGSTGKTGSGAVSPAQVLETTAPGDKTYKSNSGSVVIDASNTADGYVMIASTVSGDPKLVVMITGPDDVQYKYFFTDAKGKYQAFPLTAGSGVYQVGVYMNTSGNKYTTLYSADVRAALGSSTAPFLRPNLFVDYNKSTLCVVYATTLCGDCQTQLETVETVYNYVVDTIDYDYDLAATVATGYRPVLDTVWTTKKGICFDYASVMAAMLRTQGIPTRLVVGYAGTEYHAWVSVYTAETGWIESIIYFDGKSWTYMDPTFAASGSSKAKSYITDSSNYDAKYIY